MAWVRDAKTSAVACAVGLTVVVAGTSCGGELSCDAQRNAEPICGTGRALYCCPEETAVEEVQKDDCTHTIYPACFCCDAD